MREGLVIGGCVGFGVPLLLLIGLIVGQLSVWRWLNKRYGVSLSVPFYRWLDHKLEEVVMSGLKAEINRSCTPEQAHAIREVFERQGWVEGVDFIDHTARGTLSYSQEEMEAFREMLKKASMVESVAGQSEVPEYVDLAKLYEAQKILRGTGFDFCDQCGVTNPKHGFYPLHHSHVVWNGELLESVSSVTCNCCHATEKNPCPYCAEEEKTGVAIDVRAKPAP